VFRRRTPRAALGRATVYCCWRRREAETTQVPEDASRRWSRLLHQRPAPTGFRLFLHARGANRRDEDCSWQRRSSACSVRGAARLVPLTAPPRSYRSGGTSAPVMKSVASTHKLYRSELGSWPGAGTSQEWHIAPVRSKRCMFAASGLDRHSSRFFKGYGAGLRDPFQAFVLVWVVFIV